MDTVTIRGSRGLDGDYPFDLEEHPLTTLEWRWIKKISGYMPLTIDEGRRGGDPDVVLAFATIALVRAGKVDKSRALIAADQLAELAFDGESISVETDGEDDADPPTSVTSTSSPPPDGGETSKPPSDSPSGSVHEGTGAPG